MPGRKRKETMTLSVTVSGTDLDDQLYRVITDPGGMRLRGLYKGSVTVEKIARTDGVEIGLESEFEQWWSEVHAWPDDEESPEKMWAREAFQWGVKFGRGRS